MKLFVCVIKGHKLQWVLSRSKTAIAVAMRNEKLLKKLFAGCDALRKKSGGELVALTPINVELIKLPEGPSPYPTLLEIHFFFSKNQIKTNEKPVPVANSF